MNAVESPEMVEAIARRVVELLRAEEGSGPAVSAAEIARRFDLSRDWVYRHARELGAQRIGVGERPRLRFYPEKVSAYLASCSSGRQTPAPGSGIGKPDRPRPRSAGR